MGQSSLCRWNSSSFSVSLHSGGKQLAPLALLARRWRTNMAVTLPVTTTTCVTWPSCSGLTWVTRWCFSPPMELGLATSGVAPFKGFTPLLILGQVSVTQQHLSCLKSLFHFNGSFFLYLRIHKGMCMILFYFFIILGSNVTAAFEAQRHAEPHGPLVDSQLDLEPFLDCISFLSEVLCCCFYRLTLSFTRAGWTIGGHLTLLYHLLPWQSRSTRSWL